MNDLISRQAAIDALDEQIEQCDKALSSFDISMKDGFAVKAERASLVAFRETLEYLPSAEPQIIRCKDCKHFIRDDIEEHTPYGFYNTYFHAFCDKHWDREQGEYIDVNLDDFCSFAERRTE